MFLEVIPNTSRSLAETWYVYISMVVSAAKLRLHLVEQSHATRPRLY